MVKNSVMSSFKLLRSPTCPFNVGDEGRRSIMTSIPLGVSKVFWGEGGGFQYVNSSL